VEKRFQNGSQYQYNQYSLASPNSIPNQSHASTIQDKVLPHHNSMWYFMTPLALYHVPLQMNCPPTGLPSLNMQGNHFFDSDVDKEFIKTLSKDFADPPDIRKQHVIFVDESEAASAGV
jgi:hypothetical protein